MRKWVTAVATLTLVLGLATVASGHGEHVSNDVAGTFSTTCGSPRTSHHAMEDPIVFPGQTNVGHLHEFFGNDSTNAFSTYASMTTATTDCNFEGDTAGYWAPALIAPDGSTYTAYNHWVYYRDFDCTGRTGAYCNWGQEIVPFPAGLKEISSNYYFRCLVNGVRTDSPSLNLNCDPGSYLTYEVSFAQCWDGVHLDSADHRSHMSNTFVLNAAGQRVCPDSHPVRMPGMSLFALFVPDGLDSRGYRLSSDIQAGPGTVPGTTMHADFWNTWDQSEMERITQVCLIAHGDIPESPDYTGADGTEYDPSCLQADSQFAPGLPPPTTTSPPPTPPPPDPPSPLERFCKRHPNHRRCR